MEDPPKTALGTCPSYHKHTHSLGALRVSAFYGHLEHPPINLSNKHRMVFLPPTTKKPRSPSLIDKSKESGRCRQSKNLAREG